MLISFSNFKKVLFYMECAEILRKPYLKFLCQDGHGQTNLVPCKGLLEENVNALANKKLFLQISDSDFNLEVCIYVKRFGQLYKTSDINLSIEKIGLVNYYVLKRDKLSQNIKNKKYFILLKIFKNSVKFQVKYQVELRSSGFCSDNKHHERIWGVVNPYYIKKNIDQLTPRALPFPETRREEDESSVFHPRKPPQWVFVQEEGGPKNEPNTAGLPFLDGNGQVQLPKPNFNFSS